MAVTIKQLAEAAGVSRGTVDRVLHNRGGVKEEVSKHVRDIATRFGYLPNRAGKFLAACKQPIKIGCLLPSIGNDYFLDIIKGIRMAETELYDFGVTVELREVRGFYPDLHVKVLNDMAKNGYNALCVISADTPEIRESLDEISDMGTPVVTIDTDVADSKRICYVGSNYLISGKTAGGLLVRCSSQEDVRLIIATGNLSVKCHRDRINGFEQVLNQRKLKYEVLNLFETQDDDDLAYERAKQAFDGNEDFNWMYITSAGVGGICKAVMELSPKRRKNLRIICFDDTSIIRKYMKKGIIDFAVCQEPKQQGYHAIKKIFDYFLDGGKNIPDDYITRAVIKIAENLSVK